MKETENIREHVWKIIGTDHSITSGIGRGIINTRALAKYIQKEYNSRLSLDAIISAIRRYPVPPVGSRGANAAYALLHSAKTRTITKVASLSLRKTEDVHQKLAELLPRINYSEGDFLRILEAAKIFKIIFDRKNYKMMLSSFRKQDVIGSESDLGMIEMVYQDSLQKTPGVFSVISGELAENGISILDALICSNEHIIIVNAKDTLKAFDIIYNLCN
ncbi:hypothetical protein J4401_06830 [Candidatus Woesearchaeota archaeon]|nr:hypothetical protein [Candidatus Woesearchaeota archaeon]